MKSSRGILVLILVSLALLRLGPLFGLGDQWNKALTLFFGLGFTILHGSLTLGKTRLAVFFGITIIVSFTCEAVGIATGWVFGSYQFSDHLGPKLLGVPPLIQAAYVGMGYASLIMARIILSAEKTPRGWNLLAVTLCATVIMVAWDVSIDPWLSTIAGDWTWRDGGAFFGVPIHNYTGWFCNVFIFLFLYLMYESANPLPSPAPGASSRLFWSMPVIYYILSAAGIILTPVIEGIKQPVSSPQNYAGTLDSFQQGMTLVCLFAMGVPALIALCRLLPKSDAE